MTDRVVVADVGGTNVRFARASHDLALGDVRAYRLADFTSFEAAFTHYLGEAPAENPPSAVAIGAAGQVERARVVLTNAPYAIDADALRALLAPGATMTLVNDLEAVAYALPVLTNTDFDSLTPSAGDEARANTAAAPAPAPGLRRTGPSPAPLLAVNVGTGFGAAALRPLFASSSGQLMPYAASSLAEADSTGERPSPEPAAWVASATEAGHQGEASGHAPGLAARPRDGASAAYTATVEDVLSGRGVVALASALDRAVGGRDADECKPEADLSPRTAEALFAGDDVDAVEVRRRFAAILGATVRNLVLAHGAWRGVALTGSVIDGWLAAPQPTLDAFFKAFQATHLPANPATAGLASVPLSHIKRPNTALLGLAALACAR
ncbi:MAG: glucokinase [Pseudomonadota bacterium]